MITLFLLFIPSFYSLTCLSNISWNAYERLENNHDCSKEANWKINSLRTIVGTAHGDFLFFINCFSTRWTCVCVKMISCKLLKMDENRFVIINSYYFYRIERDCYAFSFVLVVRGIGTKETASADINLCGFHWFLVPPHSRRLITVLWVLNTTLIPGWMASTVHWSRMKEITKCSSCDSMFLNTHLKK